MWAGVSPISIPCVSNGHGDSHYYQVLRMHPHHVMHITRGYGLNCVPPKFTLESQPSQPGNVTIFGDGAFKKVIKLK